MAKKKKSIREHLHEIEWVSSLINSFWMWVIGPVAAAFAGWYYFGDKTIEVTPIFWTGG